MFRTADGARAAIRMDRQEGNVLTAASLRQQSDVLRPQLERLYLNVLMKTADAPEGGAAFLEKRRPTWVDC